MYIFGNLIIHNRQKLSIECCICGSLIRCARLLIEHLDSEGSVFRSNHASNYLTLKGTLNRDREAMCEQIRTALERGGYKKEYFRAL